MAKQTHRKNQGLLKKREPKQAKAIPEQNGR
jgi:hypothetical protein